eukprot:12330-Heterococcus_DN1.PRE.2
MQRLVMEQLGEIKLSKGGGRRTSSSTTTATTPISGTPRDTQLEILQLQRMLSRAEADRDELQANLSLTTTASNRSAGETTTAISKGDGAGVKVLQSQLRDSEKKCAALLSSNTMLESELDNYKKYIQKVVQRYQETVQQLQAELKAAKGMPLL